METVLLKTIDDDDANFEISLDGGVAQKFQAWVLDRSHVLRQTMQSAENSGITPGSISVPAGYLSTWLSYVTDEHSRNRLADDSHGLDALVELLKAADFFADDRAVSEISTLLARIVFEKEDCALKQEKVLQKARENEMRMMSPRRSPRRSSGSNVATTEASSSKVLARSDWTAEDSEEEITDSATSLARTSIPMRRYEFNDSEVGDGKDGHVMEGTSSSMLNRQQRLSDLGEGYGRHEGWRPTSSLYPSKLSTSSIVNPQTHEDDMSYEQRSSLHTMHLSKAVMGNRRHTDAGITTPEHLQLAHEPLTRALGHTPKVDGGIQSDASRQLFSGNLYRHSHDRKFHARRPSVSFQTLKEISKRSIDDERYSSARVGEAVSKVFEKLPENLIISVIQESQLDLLKSFSLTPLEYHSIALRARFPHITRDCSLQLVESFLSTTASTGVLGCIFKVVGDFPNLQKLQLCTPVHARVTTDIFDDFQSALCKLTNLHLLHLEGGIVTPAAVEAIAQSAASLKNLKTIILHRVGTLQVAGSAKPLVLRSGGLFQALSSCKTLQCISVRYLSMKSTGSNEESLSTLLRIPALKSLDLANNALSLQDMEAMAYYLTTTDNTLPDLEDINFSGNDLGNVGTRHLVDFVRKTPGLKILNFSRNNVSSEGASYLAAALRGLQNLTQLDIGGNELGDGFRPVAQALKALTTIQYLSLNSCRNIDGRVLGTCVAKMSSLARIDLRMCNLEVDPDSIDGLYAFATGLQQIRHVREIFVGIEDCMFDTALEIIMPRVALQENLRTLHLKSEVNFVIAADEDAEEENDIASHQGDGSEAGAEDDAESMVGEEDDIDESDMEREDEDESMLQTTSLDRVGQHLKRLAKLQDLAISSSLHMSRTDAETLAEVLPTMTSLRKLSLQCKSSDDSPEILAKTVAKLSSLRELELCSCGITESSAGQLGYSLGSLTNLKLLCLKGNKLRDAGAVVLAAHLQHVRSLKVVDFSATRITNVGASALTEAVDLQGVVKTCWLQDNRIQRKKLPKRARKFAIMLGPSV